MLLAVHCQSPRHVCNNLQMLLVGTSLNKYVLPDKEPNFTSLVSDKRQCHRDDSILTSFMMLPQAQYRTSRRICCGPAGCGCQTYPSQNGRPVRPALTRKCSIESKLRGANGIHNVTCHRIGNMKKPSGASDSQRNVTHRHTASVATIALFFRLSFTLVHPRFWRRHTDWVCPFGRVDWER